MDDALIKEHDLAEVFELMKKQSKERKFKESVELQVKLLVDPTKGD